MKTFAEHLLTVYFGCGCTLRCFLFINLGSDTEKHMQLTRATQLQGFEKFPPKITRKWGYFGLNTFTEKPQSQGFQHLPVSVLHCPSLQLVTGDKGPFCG